MVDNTVFTPQVAEDQPGTLTLTGLDGDGAASEGVTITASVIDPDGVSGPITYTFSDITDASNPIVLQSGAGDSYTPDHVLSGKSISVSASYTDDAGYDATLTAYAGTVADVDRPATLTVSGRTNGRALVGTTITANATDPDGLSNPVRYVFSRNYPNGDFAGTAQEGYSPDYTVTEADIGYVIRVETSIFDDQGHFSALGEDVGRVITETIPPETTINRVTGSGSTRTFQFGGTDNVGVVGYLVTVDGQVQQINAPTVTLQDLAEGEHTLEVQAFDADGNIDPTPATYTWTVDTIRPAAPTVALANDTGVAGDFITWDPTLQVTPSEPDGTILYRLDNGPYVTELPTDIADGKHNVLVYQRDAAGNLSASSNRLTFTLDRTNVVTMSTSVVNSSTPKITGTGEAGSTVTVFDNGSPVGATTVSANGTWSLPVTLRNAPSHTVVARSVDRAGNPAYATTSLTLDTTPPDAPVIALGNDTGASPTDGLTSDATLRTTVAEWNATTFYRVDGGAYLTEMPTDLADGRHSVLAYQRDAAGNLSASSNRLYFTLDTSTNVAISTAGGSTNRSKQTITGTGEAGATVSLVNADGAPVATAVVGSNGAWKASVTLAEGAQSYTAFAVDKAGNTAVSETIGFTLDTTPPAAPSVALLYDSGVSETDGLTFYPGLDVSTSEPDGTLVYRLDSGAYFTDWDPYSIAEGRHSALVYQRDAAGNLSAASNRLYFTVDHTAPAVAITSGGGQVTPGVQTISGTGEAGATVEVSDYKRQTFGTTTVARDGTWSFEFTLNGSGEHRIQAVAIDKAGNARESYVDVFIPATPIATNGNLNRMIQAMAVAPSSASTSSSPVSAPQDQKHTLIAASHG